MGTRKRKTDRSCRALLFGGLILLGTALLGVPVQAEGTEYKTQVGASGSYVQEGDYTVIIPPSISLKAGEAATLDISVGAGTNIAVGRQLTVRLKKTDSVAGGELIMDRYDAAGKTKQTGTEADTVKVALSKKAAADSAFTALKGTEIIAAYSDLAAANTSIGTFQLTPQAEMKNTKAGVYKGTVVFSIALETVE